ncbi:MAG: MoaD/ThiS family protein [Candidatus Bathyarchaeia archaeon]
MKIRVKFLATMAELTGTSTEDIELPTNASVKSALLFLAKRYGKNFYERMFEDSDPNKINRYIKLMINGRDVEFLDGLATRLKENDVLYIVPPIMGG